MRDEDLGDRPLNVISVDDGAGLSPIIAAGLIGFVLGVLFSGLVVMMWAQWTR